MVTGDAKLMVRHGGKLQRSSDGRRPKYVGGETRLVKVSRSASLRELHDRLAAVAGCFKVALYYVRPNDPDALLRDLATEDDARQVLSWALLRDLLIDPEKIIPCVRVFVVSMDVRQPLPEWLFSVAPTTPISTPPGKAPVSLRKRNASAPSLSSCSANDTSKPPSPSLVQRSASASRLTPPSTNPITSKTAATETTRATQQEIRHYTATSPAAMQRGPAPVYPAPVFMVPVYPFPPPKRIASAPSLSPYSTNGTAKPPSPSLIQRSTSASTLSHPSTNPTTTTTAAAPFPAIQSGPVLGYPAPVYLMTVAPAIVYEQVIPVYQGFFVPAGRRNVIVQGAA